MSTLNTKQLTILGREKAVEALASICRDYRGTALRALRSGGESVHIPVSTDDPRGLLEALADPENSIMSSRGNQDAGEPCYASVDEFLSGTNADGTVHQGRLEIDVVAKLVTGIYDRRGNYLGPIPTSDQMIQALSNKRMGRLPSYCL